MADLDRPAVEGGSPVKTTPYGKIEHRYGEEELEELKEVLSQGTLFYSQGKKVHQLEEAFAAACAAPHAIACSSGTAGIHAAMIAAGLSPDDEVITSPITDMGSVIPILYQGAVPVFADLHPHSYTLLPESVEAAITPKTRAVLAVHLWGNACDLEALSELCRQRDLVLIEDCAQAHGARYRGQHVGMLGDYGCFSLNEYKQISCGDGGIVITKDQAQADLLRLATDKCYNRAPGVLERNPTFLANNYRMTELQAAVSLAQLRRLDAIVSHRREGCCRLLQRLEGVEGITLPLPTPGCDPSWWFFMLRVQPDKLGVDADAFARALRAEGLSAGAHYIGKCVYEFPIFTNHSAYARGDHPYSARAYEKGLCPTAEAILDTCVMLSVSEAYTERDWEETGEAVAKVARWYRHQLLTQ
jgi:dTDP-4-amino-4,6-dideoxygalactose transaminase